MVAEVDAAGGDHNRVDCDRSLRRLSCVCVVPVEPTLAVVYYSLAELMSLVPLVACIRLQGLQSPSECDPGLFTELVFMLLHSLY